MADPTVKLRIETSGAPEARRDMATLANEAAELGARTTEAAKARVLAQADATKATAAEAEAMSVLEKQAKRAADAVERLALSRGKTGGDALALADTAFDKVRAGASPSAAVQSVKNAFDAEAAAARAAAKAVAEEEAALKRLEAQAVRTSDAVMRMALAKGKSSADAGALADIAGERVRSGERAPDVLWKTKAGLAAEAAALREIAAESSRADTGLGKVGNTLATTTTKTNGLAAAGRLLLNAFLPDILVSRVLSGGRALIAVLSGMTAATVGLSAVLGGGALAAFLAFRAAMKDNEEAADRLNRTIDEQSRLAEQAAERHDELTRSMGQPLDAAEKAWRAVAEGSSEYERNLRRIESALDDVLAIELRRIGLTESEEKQKIRAEYDPRLKAAHAATKSSEAEEARLATEFSRKIGAAGSPEQARALRDERDAALAAQRQKTDAARDSERLLEADMKSKQEAAASAAKVAAEEQRLTHAREKAALAAAALAKRQEAAADAEYKSEQLDTEHARQKALFAANPDLAPHAGILNEKDPATRHALLAALQKDLADKGNKAAELDKQIDDRQSPILDALVPFYAYARHDETQRLRKQRAELGVNPATAAHMGGDLLAADQSAIGAGAARTDAIAKLADAATALSTLKAAATDAARSLAVVKTDAGFAAADRATATADRAADAAAKSSLRTAAAQDTAAFRVKSDAAAGEIDHSLANFGVLFTEKDERIKSIADNARSTLAAWRDKSGASKGDLEATAAALAQLADATKGNADESAAIRAHLARVDSLIAQLSGQVRTGGAR